MNIPKSLRDLAEKENKEIQEHKELVRIILESKVELSYWESGFIESMNSRLNRGDCLVGDQITALEKIFDERVGDRKKPFRKEI